MLRNQLAKFQVDDVEPSRERLLERRVSDSLLFRKNLLGCSHPQTPFIGASLGSQAVLAATEFAHDKHLPLVFSPDAIWITILYGLARHIGRAPEKWRHHFVRFEGKFTLKILASSGQGAVAAFSEQLKRHTLPEIHDRLVADFSTTDDIALISSQICLMDICQHFFDYEMEMICGIPSITLEGTLDDWRRLEEKARFLEGFELDHWLARLYPFLSELVQAASGKPNRSYWKNLFQHKTTPGIYPGDGPREFFNGEILSLFPYYGESQRVENRGKYNLSDFGNGLCEAPVKWGKRRLSFRGGLLGVVQDPDTCAVKPTPGWIINEVTPDAKTS